jgi:uncharacterized delta-60 repeat protein
MKISIHDRGLNSSRFSRILLNLTSALAVMSLAAVTVRAAAGDVDLSFNSGLGASGAVATVSAVALQADGKIVAAGTFSQSGNQARGNIARFNTDGGLDPTFLSSGGGANGDVLALLVQTDGKILLFGDFTTVNGAARNRIARLNSDGTLDYSFLAGSTGTNFAINTAALQSNGKIVIGGRFTNVNGTTRNRIARLNSDGTLDNSFLAAGSGINGEVFSLALQTDGKTVIGGFFTSVNGATRFGVARLNSDGTNDASFLTTAGFGVNNSVFAVAVQPDGRIVIGGLFTNVNGAERNGCARLNADGNLDGSFMAIGSGANAPLHALALQTDGKIVIGGAFTIFSGSARNGIARLNTNGTVDTSFLATGSGVNNIVRSLGIQGDGKVVLGGAFTIVNDEARAGIARLNDTGTLDNPGPGVVRHDVAAAGVQSDGKVIIGGGFVNFAGTGRNRIARLNNDGTLDTSFLAAGSGANGDVLALAIQTDGKIVIGGTFTNVNGTARNRIARLNTDGSLDAGFVVGAGADSAVRKIAIQADGRILIGGSFANIDGVTRNGIARLGTNGTLDGSFLGSGNGANGAVSTLALQSDGKVLIGGDFTSFNGTSRNRVARLNADGTLDTTFLSSGNGANDQLFALAVQTDGKILIGGLFTAINNVARSRIARLNANGTLDTGFANADGANSAVRAMAVQSDGRIVIGGEFGNYNNVYRGGIARLKTDGSLDETFINFNSGANGRVNGIALQSDGRVIIGGLFSTVNDFTRGGVARLTIDTALNPIDAAVNMVTQHYRDFLSREPDPDGRDFWTRQITSCGNDLQCIEVKRINVSASFFLSIEFQQTGYLVERMYKTAYGDQPATSQFPSTHQLNVPIIRFNEFLSDTRRVGRGVIVLSPGWEQLLENNKQAYALEFVQTARFVTDYPTSMTPTAFVDKLNANAGNVLSASERTAIINLFGGATNTANNTARAQAVRQVAEDTDLFNAEFNRAFVLAEYFGYLRRNPNDAPENTLDYTGYDFWLTKLNQFNGNYIDAEMVKAFLSSIEYRQRFGS